MMILPLTQLVVQQDLQVLPRNWMSQSSSLNLFSSLWRNTQLLQRYDTFPHQFSKLTTFEVTLQLQEFVTSTESTRRVQAWHEMIQPRLREAESRRDFDIHLYGSRILDKFGSDAPVGGNCSFSKVVQQQPKNEIARFFLATLQLVICFATALSISTRIKM